MLGISIDTSPSAGEFARSLSLKFPLLSDWPKNEVARAYGTLDEDRPVSRRVTFVIDKEGIVRGQVVSDTDMAKHARESLRLVRELEGLA